MEDLSIIIPSRKERFLNKTILELQKRLKSNYEIIVILDGADELRIKGVRYIYNKKSQGMRTAINQGVSKAHGKYIMKLDAHCMIDEGMDTKLIREHKSKWIQIPTRKRLNAHQWEISEKEKPDINYMALDRNYMGFKDNFKNRDEKLKEKLIDETEVFQGSCYFMEREYFKKLGLLDDINFDGSGHEAAEIAYKVKEDGGKIIRNKKTWYAHARLSRHYVSSKDKSRKSIKLLYAGNSLLH